LIEKDYELELEYDDSAPPIFNGGFLFLLPPPLLIAGRHIIVNLHGRPILHQGSFLFYLLDYPGWRDLEMV
jgi:hypothetical protein